MGTSLGTITSVAPVNTLFDKVGAIRAACETLGVYVPISVMAIILFCITNLLTFGEHSSRITRDALSNGVIPCTFLTLFTFNKFIFFRTSRDFLGATTIKVTTTIVGKLVFYTIFCGGTCAGRNTVDITTAITIKLILLTFSCFPPRGSFISCIPRTSDIGDTILRIGGCSRNSTIPLIRCVNGILCANCSGRSGSCAVARPRGVRGLITLRRGAISSRTHGGATTCCEDLRGRSISCISCSSLGDSSNAVNFTMGCALGGNGAMAEECRITDSIVVSRCITTIRGGRILGRASLGRRGFGGVCFSCFSCCRGSRLNFCRRARARADSMSSTCRSSCGGRLATRRTRGLHRLLVRSELGRAGCRFVRARNRLFSVAPPCCERIAPTIRNILYGCVFSPRLSRRGQDRLVTIRRRGQDDVVKDCRTNRRSDVSRDNYCLFRERDCRVLPCSSGDYRCLGSLKLVVG